MASQAGAPAPLGVNGRVGLGHGTRGVEGLRGRRARGAAPLFASDRLHLPEKPSKREWMPAGWLTFSARGRARLRFHFTMATQEISRLRRTSISRLKAQPFLILALRYSALHINSRNFINDTWRNHRVPKHSSSTTRAFLPAPHKNNEVGLRYNSLPTFSEMRRP